MIDALGPYGRYRADCPAWLGSLPEHWPVRRAGTLFACRNEGADTALPIMEVSLRTGVRLRDEAGGARKQAMADRSGYRTARRGDIVYNTMRMWQGAVGVAPSDGLVSPAYVVAQPYAEADARYFERLFRTHACMGEIDTRSRGIVPDRNRLYWESFKDLPLARPPVEEQATIVRFLAHADRRIQRYVRAKQRAIALMEEERLAIIRTAVLRGLDASAKTKFAASPWIGQIPALWTTVSLGRISRLRCDGPFGSGLKSSHYTDAGVRVVRLQNIGHGEFKSAARAFISPEHYATLGDHSVEPDDLIVAGLGDDRHPAGRACVAPYDLGPAMVKADCFRFRLDSSRAHPAFVALQLTATAGDACAVLSSGATRQRINLETTARREVALPPLADQVAICEHITVATRPARNASARAHREIALLHEYRTRLIADVVTGKLDVRAAAAELPDDADGQGAEANAASPESDGVEDDAEAPDDA